ncbi:DMT family transporter [Thermodesulfobacteriota bacterium]
MNRHILGGLLITLSMGVFSLIGPFVRYIQLPPLVIIFYTSALTAALLLAWFGITGNFRRLKISSHVPWLFFSAVFLLVNVYAFYTAYTLTTMANAVLTHYTAPVFAAVLAPLVLKERLEKITVVSLSISMCGLVLIASDGIAISQRHLAGISYGVLSGLCYGISILFSKKLVQHFPATVIMFYQCLLTLLLIVPFLHLFPYTLSLPRFGMLGLYAVVVGILGVLTYLKGLRHVEAQHAGILAYSEPVCVTLLGMLLYREMPALQSILGGVLIVLSGFLVIRAEVRR